MSTSKRIIALGLLLGAPGLTFAAYNDATITTSGIITVGDVTLNVSSASTVFESLTVSGTTFAATMAPGSTAYITSTDRASFSVSQPGHGVSYGTIGPQLELSGRIR